MKLNVKCQGIVRTLHHSAISFWLVVSVFFFHCFFFHSDDLFNNKHFSLWNKNEVFFTISIYRHRDHYYKQYFQIISFTTHLYQTPTVLIKPVFNILNGSVDHIHNHLLWRLVISTISFYTYFVLILIYNFISRIRF